MFLHFSWTYYHWRADPLLKCQVCAVHIVLLNVWVATVRLLLGKGKQLVVGAGAPAVRHPALQIALLFVLVEHALVHEPIIFIVLWSSPDLDRIDHPLRRCDLPMLLFEVVTRVIAARRATGSKCTQLELPEWTHDFLHVVAIFTAGALALVRCLIKFLDLICPQFLDGFDLLFMH